MDKVFQVFLSSTFSDLKDERSKVSNALAKAGYFIAGMELFPATDQEQWPQSGHSPSGTSLARHQPPEIPTCPAKRFDTAKTRNGHSRPG